jgi:hypothetical protein
VTLPIAAELPNEKEKGVFTWLKKWRKGREAEQSTAEEIKQRWEEAKEREAEKQRWEEAKEREAEKQGQQEAKQRAAEEKQRWREKRREEEEEEGRQRQQEIKQRQDEKRRLEEENRRQQEAKQRKAKTLRVTKWTHQKAPSAPDLPNHEPKICGHNYCSLNTDQCCACSDQRVGMGGFERYVDGVGFVNDASRGQFYCPGCKSVLKA